MFTNFSQSNYKNSFIGIFITVASTTLFYQSSMLVKDLVCFELWIRVYQKYTIKN